MKMSDDFSIVSLDIGQIGHPSENNLLAVVHVEVRWPG